MSILCKTRRWEPQWINTRWMIQSLRTRQEMFSCFTCLCSKHQISGCVLVWIGCYVYCLIANPKQNRHPPRPAACQWQVRKSDNFSDRLIWKGRSVLPCILCKGLTALRVVVSSPSELWCIVLSEMAPSEKWILMCYSQKSHQDRKCHVILAPPSVPDWLPCGKWMNAEDTSKVCATAWNPG